MTKIELDRAMARDIQSFDEKLTLIYEVGKWTAIYTNGVKTIQTSNSTPLQAIEVMFSQIRNVSGRVK